MIFGQGTQLFSVKQPRAKRYLPTASNDHIHLHHRLLRKSIFLNKLSLQLPQSTTTTTTTTKMLLQGVSISPLPIPPQSQQHRPHLKTATVSALTPFTPAYSISDQTLESKGFLLKRTTSGLNLDHLNSIFVAVGFPKRDTDKIRIALSHTDAMLWIEDAKRSRPVAFARATGDGVFSSIIWDVVVDPGYQGIGLGKAVMERLVDELLEKGIVNIALYSEPRVLGFYRPLGFVADPDGIRGMVYSRKPQQKK